MKSTFLTILRGAVLTGILFTTGTALADPPVRFYEHSDRKGDQLGAYVGGRRSLSGQWNDNIGSVWIREGYIVTVYEHPNFQGRRKVLRAQGRDRWYNLSDVNDMVSSYRIEPDPSYRHDGDRRPGGYPGGHHDDDHDEDDRRAPVTFYRDYSRRGPRLGVGTGSRGRLDATWDNSISSVRVAPGYEVRIYDGVDLRGDFRVIRGGSRGVARDLTDFNDRISSYRVGFVRQDGYDGHDGYHDGYRDDDHDGYYDDHRDDYHHDGGAYYDGGPYGPPAVRFFRDLDARGSIMEFRGDAAGDLYGNWNDAVSSISVPAGFDIIVYEHANYRGASRRFPGSGPGRLYNLREFNDRISSYRIRYAGGEVYHQPAYPPPVYGTTAHAEDCFISTILDGGGW